MKEPSWWLCFLAYINYGNARRRVGALRGWRARKAKKDDFGVKVTSDPPSSLSGERGEAHK